jgi:protein-tyrosine phosphatase
MSDRIAVLFVCMGNICRSPMAESVFRHLVAESGLTERFSIDSAGTHPYHLGHRPHPETQAELQRNGVAVGDSVSRLVEAGDFENFDYIVAMDRDNLTNLRAVAEEAHAEVFLLLDGCGTDVDEVPDPYYVGGYDRVYELVHAGCSDLLERIVEREGLLTA